MKTIRPLLLLLGITALAGVPLFGDPTPTADAAPTALAAPEAARPAPSAAKSDAPAISDDLEKKADALRELAPATPAAPEAVQSPEKPEAPARPEAPERAEKPERRERSGGRGGQVVSFGNAYLSEGNTAEAVVAIFGNAEAHGAVGDSVVAILGNSLATEHVEDTVVAVLGNSRAEKDVGGNVVAVLGDASANGHVGGNVVSVLGTIELGPNARIDGDVVCVGGLVHRDPSAVVSGNTTELAFLRHMPFVGKFGLLIQETIGRARLLSFHKQLAGAWGIAITFLLLYLVITLAFGKAVTRCVDNFERRPGMTVLTALVSFLLTPVLLIPLAFTVVGALAFIIALFIAVLVGKAAFLGWIGRRIGGSTASTRIGLAVLFGGFAVLVLYAVPLVGVLLWCAGTALGFGTAVYTAITTMRRDRDTRAPMPRSSTQPTPVSLGATAATLGAVPASPPTTVAPSPEGNTFVPPAPPSIPSAAAFEAAGPSGAATPLPPVQPIAPVPPSPTPPPPPISGAGTARPPVVLALGLPRAGFWIRLAASALDVVLVGMVGHVAFMQDYFLLLMTCYCVVLWALRGTTIGGIICGLKIVRLDDRPVDWSIAIVRVLGAFLSLCVVGLGFIWVAFDPEMQSWHDKVAGTTIVRVPKGTPLV